MERYIVIVRDKDNLKSRYEVMASNKAEARSKVQIGRGYRKSAYKVKENISI